MTYLEELKKSYPEADIECLSWIDSKSLEHKNHLDNEFRKELLKSENFSSRIWELILCDILIQKWIAILSHKNGWPDFSFDDWYGNRIHIEAVSSGTWNGDNSISKIPESGVFNISWKITDERLLRITESLDTKRKKYENYLEKWIVNPSDILIIAVNGEKMDGCIDDVLYGWWIECFLYWVDKMVCTLSQSLDGISDNWKWGYTIRNTITKKNWEPIPTRFFCNNENSIISGVLYAKHISINYNILCLYYWHNHNAQQNYRLEHIFWEGTCGTYKEFSYLQNPNGTENFLHLN